MAPTPAHEHEHEAREHEPEDRRLRVLHGASPFCWWSYGYEPVLSRVKLLYGDQVKVNTYQVPVYEDRDEHHRGYGTDDPKVLREWVEEAAQLMHIPLSMEAIEALPRSCLPGTLAVHAAEAVKPGSGERLARLIGYHANIEPFPFEDGGAILKLAERAGAPRKQVEQALADGRAERSLAEDSQSMHALGLNFFALQLRDFEGRTVILEHAFDSVKVEEGLEWLSRGQLRKSALPEPLDYAVQHAPASLREIQEVFRLDAAESRKALEPGERAGTLQRREVLGHTFWLPAG